MSEFDYDLFVIGGGSGGVRAARIAAGHGAKVAIAEEYRFGGTCVIRGCVPKKLLVYASRFRDEFEDAAGFGWSVEEGTFDWPTLIANKDAEIARLEGLYRSGLERAGVAVMQARAELVDAHTVVVQPGSRKITARTILVATGGRPVVPDVPGAGHAITSNEAFHLRTPAEVDPDRRRRLHRRGVRLHLQRPRRRHDASLSRPEDPARLRRGAAR